MVEFAYFHPSCELDWLMGSCLCSVARDRCTADKHATRTVGDRLLAEPLFPFRTPLATRHWDEYRYWLLLDGSVFVILTFVLVFYPSFLGIVPDFVLRLLIRRHRSCDRSRERLSLPGGAPRGAKRRTNRGLGGAPEFPCQPDQPGQSR